MEEREDGGLEMEDEKERTEEIGLVIITRWAPEGILFIEKMKRPWPYSGGVSKRKGGSSGARKFGKWLLLQTGRGAAAK